MVKMSIEDDHSMRWNWFTEVSVITGDHSL